MNNLAYATWSVTGSKQTLRMWEMANQNRAVEAFERFFVFWKEFFEKFDRDPTIAEIRKLFGGTYEAAKRRLADVKIEVQRRLLVKRKGVVLIEQENIRSRTRSRTSTKNTPFLLETPCIDNVSSVNTEDSMNKLAKFDRLMRTGPRGLKEETGSEKEREVYVQRGGSNEPEALFETRRIDLCVSESEDWYEDLRKKRVSNVEAGIAKIAAKWSIGHMGTGTNRRRHEETDRREQTSLRRQDGTKRVRQISCDGPDDVDYCPSFRDFVRLRP